MLCVDCFSNHGVRTEAARIAVADGTTCPNCGGSGARLTTVGKVDQLLQRFFVHGATGPTGTQEPVFKLSRGKLEAEREPVFDRTLRGDYALLVRHSSGSLFRNAPRSWRLGYTTIEEDLDTAIAATTAPARDESVCRLLDRLVDHCRVAVIPVGRSIYRLRSDVVHPFDPTEFDAPPTALASPTRFSDGLQPVLYGALDVETCLHECRVLAEHRLTLATLVTTGELRVIDLTQVPFDGPDESGGEGGDLFYFINARLVFGPRSTESRLFGTRIRDRGFNGIIYPSFFSELRPDRQRHPNIALFGNPLHDGTVVLGSLNRLRLDTIRFDFTFGPATQALSRADIEDFVKLASELRDDADPLDVARRLREITGRSDPKD